MNASLKNPFHMDARQDGDEMIYYLVGIIDQKTGASIWESLQRMDSALTVVALNLSEVRLITSAGLGVMVQIASHIKKSGRTVKFLNPSVPVRRVMELTHIDQMAVIE